MDGAAQRRLGVAVDDGAGALLPAVCLLLPARRPDGRGGGWEERCRSASRRRATARRASRAEMEAVKSLLKPKPTPQQQLCEWQCRLRNEGRNIERQIRDVQKKEKKVEKEIREAAKRDDIGTAKALAKELVRSRKAVNRLYENKAQLNSISIYLGEFVGQ